MIEDFNVFLKINFKVIIIIIFGIHTTFSIITNFKFLDGLPKNWYFIVVDFNCQN